MFLNSFIGREDPRGRPSRAMVPVILGEVFILIIGTMLLSSAGLAAKHKTHTNLLTPEEIQTAREKIGRYALGAREKLLSVLSGIERWMKYSDGELRDLVPSADVPRAFDVNFKQCPIHSEEIKKFGSYPWIIDPDRPYKVICPVGGEVYPTNDFDPKHPGSPSDVSQEPYVDNGWGWKKPGEDQKYWFVAYYTHWFWLRYLIPATKSLAEAYILTGERGYAHKAAVLLDRIAEVYPQMDHVKQSRYGTEIQPGTYKGRIVNAIWETGVVTDLALAYDYIFEAIADDPTLERATGKSPQKVCENIEQNLLESAARSIYTLDGRIVGNFGMHQRALATIAIVLDNENTEKYLDCALNTTGNGSWQYEGILTGLANFVFRDGAPNESSPGYNVLWVENFMAIAELMQKRGVNLYEKEPKLKKLLDYPLRLIMADNFVPNIGDAGSVRSSGPIGWSSSIYETAFRRYKDPQYARVLWKVGFSGGGSLYEKPFIEDWGAVLKESGTEFTFESDNMSAYGLAMLRRGQGSGAAGVSLYYGQGGGHGHFDRLSIELFAKAYRMTPDLGYPEYMTGFHKKLFGWTGHTISHNTVLVDEKRQTTKAGGRIQAFASSPAVQYVDVRAEEAYPGIVDTYRRSVALIDASEEDAYVVDVFRVKGGKQHDYSLHGPDGRFSVQGIELSPVQTQGTLAGENVTFGYLYDAPELERPGYKGGYSSYAGSGFSYLRNVQRGKPEGVFCADWEVADFPKPHLRITFVPEPGMETIVADGEPPQNKAGNPPNLKYVLVRNRASEGKPLDSTFVSVLQPYSKEPYIAEVSRLRGDSPDLVALEIRRTDGTDYVFQAQDVGLASVVGSGMKFQGRLGVISRASDGKLRYAYLLSGGSLTQGDIEIHAPGSYKGQISAIDFDQRKVRVTLDESSPAFPVGEVLAGGRIIISNEKHSTEYLVLRVTPLGDKSYELDLGDTDFLTGKGEVSWARSRGGTGYLGSKTPLVLDGYYDGQWLVNPATGEGRRIKSFSGAGSTITLAGDTMGLDAGGAFHIYDFGIGDRFEIASSVYVSALEDGRYLVKANVPATLTFPGGIQEEVVPGEARLVL